MNVSIIGTGNMAWHLARVFEKFEIAINEIYSREFNKAMLFTDDIYDANPKDDLDFSQSQAQIFFLCVSDNAIEEICSKILLPEKTILLLSP